MNSGAFLSKENKIRYLTEKFLSVCTSSGSDKVLAGCLERPGAGQGVVAVVPQEVAPCLYTCHVPCSPCPLPDGRCWLTEACVHATSSGLPRLDSVSTLCRVFSHRTQGLALLVEEWFLGFWLHCDVSRNVCTEPGGSWAEGVR